MLNSEKVKPIALAVIESHFSEGISQSDSPKIRSLPPCLLRTLSEEGNHCDCSNLIDNCLVGKKI